MKKYNKKILNEGAIKNKIMEIVDVIIDNGKLKYLPFSNIEKLIDSIAKKYLNEFDYEFYSSNKEFILDTINSYLNESYDNNYIVPRLFEINWPKEIRDYPYNEDEFYDEDDDIPYPGGLTQDDYEDDDQDDQYVITPIKESLSRRMWSISRIEEEKLQPIADQLEVNLYKGKKDKIIKHGKTIISQFFTIGNVNLMVRNIRFVGMSSDDCEVWFLNKRNPSKSVMFNGSNNYAGLDVKIEQELNDKREQI